MADFTETFNVGRSESGDAYHSFIRLLRNKAQDRGVFCRQLPVLPPAGSSPIRFFDVVLRTPHGSVRLRIQRDNLYLLGYRNEDGSQWYEFNEGSSVHLIEGSSFLPFSGNYRDLTRVAARRREEIGIGRQQLDTAVNDLVGSADPQQTARALLVIIQMICESTRIETIADTIDHGYTSGICLSDHCIALENCWGALCTAILQRDNNPEGSLRLPRGNFAGITDVVTAAATLGILLRQNAGSRLLRLADMDTTSGQALILNGRRLVEIFSVTLTDLEDDSTADLYGTIKATDGLKCYYIYNRDSASYEPVEPGDKATLTGPSQAISAADDFVIDFDLWRHYADAGPKSIAAGTFAWNVYSHTNAYDEPLTETIRGEFGAAILRYVVLSNAAEADVEIVLTDGDGEAPTNVYGSIDSHDTFFNGATEERKLFSRSDGNSVSVRPKGPIPLLRPALVIPMDGTLTIQVEFWDQDSEDDEFAKGSVEFGADIEKSEVKFIEAKHGKVEVKVSWW